MSAMSTSLSWSNVVSSFLCRSMPLEFQRRIVSDLKGEEVMVGEQTGDL